MRDGEDGGASGIVVNEDEKENDDVCDSSIEMSFFLDYFARTRCTQAQPGQRLENFVYTLLKKKSCPAV